VDRSVLVIEHDMEFVRQIARKVTVLHQGTVLCEGPVEQVQSDPRVLEVYLGRRREGQRCCPLKSSTSPTASRRCSGPSTSDVGPGQLVCLMGRNGVGKTTLLKTTIGLLPSRGGRVHFDGCDITTWSPDRRARAGIGYVPQGREIFPHLTVEENLRMALLGCGRAGSLDEPLALFPALKPLLRAQGRGAVGRRAADAGR